jgi:STE24 endopeptidase
MIWISLFLFLLLMKALAELWLDQLNLREIDRNRTQVPLAYQSFVSAEAYAKGVAYSVDKLRFGMLETLWGAVVLGFMVASDILPFAYHNLTAALGLGIWAQALILVLLLVALSLPGLPLDAYRTFVIEQRHGFNKTSPGLWLSDKLKGMAIALPLGVALVAMFLGFYRWLPNTWWLWAFLAFFGFQLLLLILYPRLIVPVFNKLSPLPEGPLRQRLLELGEQAGFNVTQIQVIDGSKRSGHANAYFTGFGKFRRIVLYDTLIEQLETEELAAVLAHEVGHYKRGHILKNLIVAFFFGLTGFAVVGLLVDFASFYEGFGYRFTESSIVPALLMFGLGSGLVTFWISPLMAQLSRRFEYEADAFARDMLGGNPQPLVDALRKLHTENKANLTPHPWYSAFHYSHPTLLERQAALQADA